MNFYDQDNWGNVKSLFSLVDTKQSQTEFLLRLDLIGVLASAETINLKIFMRQIWPKLFPTMALSSDLENKCLYYFDEYRLGFKLMSKGEAIRKPMMALKTLIPVVILSMIEKKGVLEIVVDQLEKDVIAAIKPFLNDELAVVNRTREISKQYFEDNTAISMELLQLLKQYRECFYHIFEELQQSLLAGKGGQKIKVRATEHSDKDKTDFLSDCHENQYCTPLKYIRIVCLMYLSLEEYRKTGASQESLFEKYWPKVFGRIPYNEEAQSDIKDLLASDSYLDALNMLFRFSLKELRNGRIIRRIIVMSCVNQVLSRLPHGSSEDMVIEEAMTLFSRFSSLSVGKEEADIEAYLKRFVATNGIVDDRISRLLWEYADSISEFLRISLENVNCADSVRKRYWWEEMLVQKDKEVSTLQNQIGATKANTIYSLIENLSSPSYDYVLGRLYRFVQGYDVMSKNEMRVAINTLMQVFHLYGVKAIGEELVDLELSDQKCGEAEITTAIITNVKSGRVVFPGWSVDGDTVALPIACKKTKGER